MERIIVLPPEIIVCGACRRLMSLLNERPSAGHSSFLKFRGMEFAGRQSDGA
jgi:hypothetical protein